MQFLRSLLLVIASVHTCSAFDTAHFYRPPFLERGPWFAKDWLTGLYVNAAYGATTNSRNCAGEKVCLLDLYEPVNTPAKAYITESVIEVYQNFKHGLFLHTHLPIRRIKLFSAERGVGDFGVALGWTINYEELEELDFLDATLQLGVTIPTSKQTCANTLFDIPLGYNGHTGLFGKFDLSVGILDWLTFGTFATGLGFNTHTQTEKIKITPEQRLLGTLPRETVRSHLGPIVSCGLLFRLDHVLRGLSFDLGYQFQHQWKNRWVICATQQPYNIPDQRLASWSMHTINVQLSYDFSHINHPCLPTIGFIYNIPVAGKRIFFDPMGGGSFSIMSSWDW